MEKEILDLQIKLKEYRTELLRKRGYMAEHGFKREQMYIQEKLDVSEQIIWAIDNVLSGNKKGINIQFSF